MCGTSGGGFSLMVEALGFAGMLEVPIVVVNSRGPDLARACQQRQSREMRCFVMHASQGEFPRIVVAPRNTKECFTLAAEAFNLAERYQCPVLILVECTSPSTLRALTISKPTR